mmetsp:Transcript_1658/g.5410  ORF Transcript_1658/g.5410 Transcript_1658/m.5410 type:complete len:282 (-) Transcript_1658:142-987(-)
MSLPPRAGRARAFTVCGTDYYVAPEVLQQAGYTSACDLWSIGVVLYILLSGCPPFFEGGEEGISVQRKIIAGKYSFPDKYWAGVSAEAKDLVRNLLQVDPSRRFKVNQCLDHPWIQGHGVSEGLLPQRNVDLLRSFNNKRKNSVAGSPLVGSYSVFGSLQSPLDIGMGVHGPGKHARMGRSIPHSQFVECGSVAEEQVSRGAPRQTLVVPVVAAGAAPDAAACGPQDGVGFAAGAPQGGFSAPMPIAPRAPQAGQQELATSPPGGILGASPNPGAAFMMEI